MIRKALITIVAVTALSGCFNYIPDVPFDLPGSDTGTPPPPDSGIYGPATGYSGATRLGVVYP